MNKDFNIKSLGGFSKVFKELCLSKDRIVVYVILSAIILFWNIFALPSVFSSKSDYISENESFGLMLAVLLINVFIVLQVMVPECMHKESTKLTDDQKPKISIGMNVFSIWLSISFFIVVQMLLFEVCDQISAKYNTDIVSDLLTSFSLCAIVFIWTVILALLYVFTKSVLWYIIGFITINISPSIISQGCHDVYNANLLLPYKDCNPFNYNVFIVSAAVAVGKPIIAALIVIIMGGALVWISHCEKIGRSVNGTLSSSIYKIITISLISLSLGFIISKNFLSKDHISLSYALAFVIVAFVTSGLISFFTFRDNKPLFNIGATVISAAICSGLIFGVIPSKVQSNSDALPNENEVVSVTIFLDSLETFEVDMHLDECLALHEKLLRKLEQNPPDKSDKDNVTPTCLANMWDRVYFNYRMESGKSFFRDYENLNDPIYDEFYIELLKSDMYAYSLQNMEPRGAKLRYHRIQNEDMVCDLYPERLQQLTKTYCDELKNAKASAFYEPYETVKLSGVYQNNSSTRVIYIPLSFTKTRSLLESYAK